MVGLARRIEPRLQQRGPRPALAAERLESVPRPLALGPVRVVEAREHRGGRLRQEGRKAGQHDQETEEIASEHLSRPS